MTKGNGKRWTERRHGWAIDIGEGKLLHASFFRSDGQVPRHMHGLTTAVFATRAVARRVLPKVREYWAYPGARVVKVETAYRAIG